MVCIGCQKTVALSETDVAEEGYKCQKCATGDQIVGHMDESARYQREQAVQNALLIDDIVDDILDD